MRYRPNPNVRIEAYEWRGDLADLPLKWRERDMFYVADDGTLMVRTPHGPAECKPGDFVAEDEGRGLYPIPVAVFERRWLADA